MSCFSMCSVTEHMFPEGLCFPWRAAPSKAYGREPRPRLRRQSGAGWPLAWVTRRPESGPGAPPLTCWVTSPSWALISSPTLGRDWTNFLPAWIQSRGESTRNLIGFDCCWKYNCISPLLCSTKRNRIIYRKAAADPPLPRNGRWSGHFILRPDRTVSLQP